MKKTALLAAAAVLAMTAGVAAHPVTAAHVNVVQAPDQHPGMKTLYSQNSNSTGVGLVSDNFTSGTYPTYSDSGADDFVVPSGSKWKVQVVDVTGAYFSAYGTGTGGATSEDITFYKDASGMPGKALKKGTYTGLTCTDTSGSFSCTLPKALKLKAGHYWVGVVANMDYTAHHYLEWGWDGTAIQNDPAMWENPGGGFGVCASWGTNSSCLGYSQDDMFDLKGKG